MRAYGFNFQGLFIVFRIIEVFPLKIKQLFFNTDIYPAPIIFTKGSGIFCSITIVIFLIGKKRRGRSLNPFFAEKPSNQKSLPAARTTPNPKKVKNA
ncbi:hypothetical protein NSS70_19050 [Aeribacillus sp. FSL K6-2848]|uniref:hypothetical protein n=1 Tax=unclassified Aeribacillus TaxID=2640495 RepID=UPI0030D0A4F4